MIPRGSVPQSMSSSFGQPYPERSFSICFRRYQQMTPLGVLCPALLWMEVTGVDSTQNL